MIRLLSISILVLWINHGFAQENTNWVDSILTAIILNEIEVFDNDLNVIKNTQIQFVTKDTVVNCLWTRPQGSFDGIVLENSIVFDTSTNQKNNQYLDFIFPKFDANGNFQNDTIAFAIKRNNSKKINHEPLQIENLINTKWEIDKILYKEKEIELDSCHEIFHLIINSDFTFTQQFGDNKTKCSTKSMNQNKEVGVEGDYDGFIEYHNKIQGHYLSVKKGIWKIEGNNLLLIDLDEKKVLSLRIEKPKRKNIFLLLDKLGYKVKMKKLSTDCFALKKTT